MKILETIENLIRLGLMLETSILMYYITKYTIEETKRIKRFNKMEIF